MAANTKIYQSPKRFKKEDSQQSQAKQTQEDSEDFSFLDDIDVDLIAKCLNTCKDPANSHEQNNANKHIASPSTKDHPKLSIKKHVVPKDPKVHYLMKQLEKQLFHVYKEDYYTSLIHNGKHSIIIKCQDVAGENIAVKILREKTIYTGEAKQKMISELQRNISKENLFCIFFNSGFSIDTRWCFVMDYYPVTLNEVMQLKKPLHIYKVQALAMQLLSAVEILHTNDIIHSDIKPSHILMDIPNENLRLCGFDDAHYWGAGKNSANVGSLNYRAPEIILGYSYGFSIDVWSTAVVLAEMATGAALFPGYSNNEILYRQMCTFGPIPNEMIVKSKYEAQYFSKDKFKRITANATKDIHMDIFHKPYIKLKKIMLEAQTYHWQDYDEKQTKRCKQKLYFFVDLLKQMMTIVPEDRSTIREAYEFFVKYIYLPVSEIG